MAQSLSPWQHRLVGENLHRCHPVAAQGLNLCCGMLRRPAETAERAARGRLAVAAIAALMPGTAGGCALTLLANRPAGALVLPNRQAVAVDAALVSCACWGGAPLAKVA